MISTTHPQNHTITFSDFANSSFNSHVVLHIAIAQYQLVDMEFKGSKPNVTST